MQFRILDYNYAFQENVSITASSENAEFPASNLRNSFRSKVWRTAQGVTSATLVIDLGSIEAIDSVALFFDPLRDIPLTENAVLYVQANPTNLWTSPAVNIALTIDFDLMAATQFWATDQNYRYWRITLLDTTNPDGFLEIAKVVLGKGTQLTRVPSNGFSYGMRDLSKVDATPYGHEYSDLYPVAKSLDFNIDAMPYVDLKTLQNIFRRVGRSVPIVVALDPLEERFDKEQFLIYGKLKEQFTAKHVNGQYFGHVLSVHEVF